MKRVFRQKYIFSKWQKRAKQKQTRTKRQQTINFEKKLNRQKIEFRKFLNCAKKTNAKKISKYFHFKFKRFEKKSIQKFLRNHLSTKTKLQFVFYSWNDFWKKKFFENKTNKNFNVKKILTKKKMTFSLNFHLWSIYDLISFLIFVKNCFCRVFARIRILFSIKIENYSRFIIILKQISFLIKIKNCFNLTFVLKNSSNSKIALFKNTFCCFWSFVTKISKRSFSTTLSQRKKWFCFHLKNILKMTKNEFSF